jgi:DNA excision repair protein ERCC-4
MTRLIEVVIDDREPNEFAGLFKDAGAESVRVERLKVGDFVVNNRWVFERKTMQDLCQSLVDGRLFQQAVNMMKAAASPVLILQGGVHDTVKTAVKREAIQGALITISVFFNIPVLRALDATEVVRLIDYTVAQEGRFNKGPAHRFGYRPKRRKARQLYILQGLPGIGRFKAERLLERFGSIQNVMTADKDELAEVEGIGKGSSKRIREILS